MGSLSCQPHAVLQSRDAFANSPPAATCSGAGSVPPLLVAFSRCFICTTHLWLSLTLRGKCAPEGLGGCKSQRPGPPHFSWGSRGAAAPCGAGGSSLGAAAGASPRASSVPPRAFPPVADVVKLGTLVRGTQLGGFLSRSKAGSSLLSEMLIIRSVPTTARGKNLHVLEEKSRSRERVA